MNATFRSSFTKDLKKIADRTILNRVRRAIEEVEAAANLSEVSQLKKMSGSANFYRIRVGDYRIGIVVEAEGVDFVRCLPRKDLYRFFP